eukprot:2429-Eustigmatos_ZCMA.PRE.1
MGEDYAVRYCRCSAAIVWPVADVTQCLMCSKAALAALLQGSDPRQDCPPYWLDHMRLNGKSVAPVQHAAASCSLD